MRTHLLLLGLSSALVLAPAACGSSSSNTGGTGDDGGSGGSSGASGGSSGTTGSSSGTTGSSSGTTGSSSGTTGSSSGHSGSSSGTGSSSGSGGSSGSSSGGMAGNHIKHIFLILMENHNWSDIKGSSSAPYINGTLLPMSSNCSNYFDNPAKNHPSEPNYIWLEAATDNFSDDNDTWVCDCDPSAGNSTASTQHLATQLKGAGKTWHAYAEDMPTGVCPVSSSGNYAVKHVPFLFFQDISGNPPSTSTTGDCTPNVVPFTQLATDLQSGTVADYNFITPNLCNDMHNNCTGDEIKQGDDWLKANIPTIMNSTVYQDSAIFITWDESEGGEFPIGMIVLSPFAKGGGYTSSIKYYHSSMVRTVEEVFGLTPLIADAANQVPLSDLFKSGMYP